MMDGGLADSLRKLAEAFTVLVKAITEKVKEKK